MNGCCGFRVTFQTKLPISVSFHLIVSYHLITAHRLARDEKFLYKKKNKAFHQNIAAFIVLEKYMFLP